MSALDDLRGVVRIARAASFGVTGNGPRIKRAEQAIADLADLVAAADAVVNGDKPAKDLLEAALARVQGGAA